MIFESLVYDNFVILKHRSATFKDPMKGIKSPTKSIFFSGQLTYRNVNVHTVLFNVPSQQSQVELFCPSFLRNFQCKESSEGISNAKKGRICNAKKKLKDGSHLKLLWTLCCCLFRKRDDQNSALQKSQNFKWWMSWSLIWCAWTRIVWNSLY